MFLRTYLKAAALICGLVTMAEAAVFDSKPIDAIFDRTPVQVDGVYRYSFPRSDLKVTVDGVTLKPALALGGWVAFKPMHGQVAIMGDIVLTESEVNPVITALIAGGVEATALHNHLLRASPAIFYLHLGGSGDPVKLAKAIRAALALTTTPLMRPAASSGDAPPLDLDTAKIDEALGAKGKASGGVYQFAIPRADKVTEGGMVLPAAMGSANVINFQPTDNGKAAITGDIAVLANEVVPLTAALRANAVEVTAIHSHMLTEEPRTFYVHFWAHDDALKLAQAMRSALEKTNVSAKGKT